MGVHIDMIVDLQADVQKLEERIKIERTAVDALIASIRNELGPPTRDTVLAIEAVRKSRESQ